MSHIYYGVIYLNKRFFLGSLYSDKTRYLGLVICGALFLCGCIIGTVCAGFVSDGTKLNDYISGYLSIFLNGTSMRPNLISSVIDSFKYHMTAALLGFSIIGVFFIPALSAVRGFFLCFSISSIVRLLGGKGILLALSIFGFSTILTIPCFLILSVYSFSASLYIFRLLFTKNAKGTVSPFNSKFFVNCCICVIVLMISALIETYLTPQLIGLAASQI